jgi:pectin-derived oligosaccharide transport system substrate-binding protein
MKVTVHKEMPAATERGPLRMDRRTLSILSILSLSTGLGACAKGGDARPGATEKVELSIAWWGGPERADRTNKALDLYTQRHPNVTFRKQFPIWKDYYPKLEAMIAGGEDLDLFQDDDNVLSEYTSRDIVLDLSAYVASRTVDETRFPESLAKCADVNGKPYAVPSAENTPALVYDRTLVKQYGMPEPQIGWSYEQLITWAAEITAKSGGTVAGTMDASGAHQAFWNWLRAQGKEMYQGKNIGFAAADLQRWFELWANARRLKTTPAPEVVHVANSGDVTKQPLLSKQAVTAFAWSNQLAELQKGTDHELGITAYPGDPKGQWARASMFWSVYKGSKHPEVTADVINFLVNDPEAGKILGTERGLPSNLDVRGQITASLPAVMQATVTFENDMVARFGPAPAPPPKGHSEFKALLTQAAEDVMYGRVTPQQGAVQFVTQAPQALSG